MASADLPDFATFFRETTGHEPFEWQAALAERLADGELPDVIDVPTGFGKTSVIHCWAYALATSSPATRLPRRLAFVVDRRLVVDAAHDDAVTLARSLALAQQDSALEPVAQTLRALHGGAADPLAVVRMRGGVTWDSRWLARPDQAAVIVGTIDQLGSRLLFRGYGVSPQMRPIDAALVGTDIWLVIDEAHIASALVQTATTVARHQQLVDDEHRVVRPLHITQMSATVRDAANAFTADLERQHRTTRFRESAKAAKVRLDATKPAHLIEIEELATGSTARRRELLTRLGRELAERARAIDSSATVIGVIANTISAARAAHERLLSQGEEACLLIGRCREYEREQLLAEYEARLRVGRPPQASRLYVVATQTIEVGADFDLDAIVTECAPLPSLVQRFGRVNRIGARPAHESTILYAGFLHGENDPIYGAATKQTWDFLRKRSRGGRDPLDFGIVPTRELLAAADDDTRAESAFVPTLLGAHLERWATTRPAPLPDQEVAPFLHGVDRSVPEVFVAWRVAPPVPPELRDDQLRDVWRQWLDLARPVEWEFVSVPIWEARALIAGVPSTVPVADLEAIALRDDSDVEPAADSEAVVGVVYAGPGDPEPVRLVRRPLDVNVGDRVVLDARLGGHDRWGWTGQRGDGLVPDVADLAPSRLPRAGTPNPEMSSITPAGCLRIDAGGRILASLALGEEQAADLQAVITSAVREATEAAGGFEEEQPQRDDLAPVVDSIVASDAMPQAVIERIRALQAADWGVRKVTIRPRTEDTNDDTSIEDVFLVELAFDRGTPLDAISDDEEGSTSSAATPQSLDVHGVEVRDLATRFARHLGVPEKAARAVALAAHLHDLGKADERFQVMLYDGDALAALAGEPRAKSGRDWRDPIARSARRIAGIPKGFRHEAVSGRLVQALIEERPDLVDGLDHELLHHLVVSHHGHARPLLPAITDLDAPTVHVGIRGLDSERAVDLAVKGASHQIDWTHPARFERLNERYGWWGLAFLETLVRLADMECSTRLKSEDPS